MEKYTSKDAFKVCRSSRMLTAKDLEELHVSYRRKHIKPCYSLLLSLDCNRQTISSGADVHTVDNSLDWWKLACAAESISKVLAVELGASQQHWYMEKRG